jgi:hypothetical protein
MDQKFTPTPVTGDMWMVPCYINREANTYQPICSPLESESLTINIKKPWSDEEDQALENLVKIQGKRAWAGICREINKLFHSSREVRKGKQCRERYFNHINPSLKKGQWLPEEDQFILEMQTSNGNKWSEIAKNLPGRNENQVKNRWKSLLNRKKGDIKEGFKIETPVAVSPPTAFVGFKVDQNFSSLAEMMRIQYFSQCNEATPPFHLYFA